MINTIYYKNNFYPKFQTEGNASQFAIPYAKHVCKGNGVDVGCMKKEWAFPGAIPIDLNFKDEYHALNIPQDLDYIFSSHCLEHTDDWVEVLDYWYSSLKSGGTLFLYLPHYSQEYWRPWNNRKHNFIFTPEILKDYLIDRNWSKIFISEKDLNNAFMIMAEK